MDTIMNMDIDTEMTTGSKVGNFFFYKRGLININCKIVKYMACTV